MYSNRYFFPNIIFLVILLIFFIFFNGCASEEDDWKKANSTNLAIAYRDFIKKYPDGRHIEEAQKNKKNLMIQERQPAFREINRIKLIINESYGNASEFRGLPIRKDLEKFLAWLEIDTVRGNPEKTDAFFIIDIVGQPRAHNYKNIRGEQYTSAELSGTITIKAPNQFKIEEKFESYIPPFKKITQSYLAPGRAPFIAAYYKGSSGFETITDCIQRAFGCYILFQMLESEDNRMNNIAKRLLTKIGKPALESLNYLSRNSENEKLHNLTLDLIERIEKIIFIESCISDLKSKVNYNRENAVRDLRKSTGQDFGEDTLSWMIWWEKYKDSYWMVSPEDSEFFIGKPPEVIKVELK